MGKAEEFLEQLENMETLKQEAIDELLAKRQEIDSTLERFGYHAPVIKRQPSGKPCRICGETGHDARRHRGEKQEASQV
jgi:hypothetical protein